MIETQSHGDDVLSESVERDFNKESIECDERSQMCYNSKIEVDYQEVVGLKRKEELIRAYELLLTSCNSDACKNLNSSMKRNNRKLKDKGKDEIIGATVVEEYDKPQQQNLADGRKRILTEDAELFLDTPEDVYDALDSVNCVLNEALAFADLDDRDSSPVNYDTDTSEAQPPIGFIVHNEARKSPLMIDDSSLTCSTDSVPSVVYCWDL
ncbi:hypothetical protein Tco_0487398 [Tanacetum coccineum]